MKFLKSPISKVLIVFIIVSLTALAIYYSSSYKGSTLHSSALPDDMTALLKLDINESVSEMGFNLVDILGSISEKNNNEVESNINIAQSGIDFKSPIFCFNCSLNSSKNSQFGCIVSLHDSREFNEFLKKIFSNIPFNQKPEIAVGVMFYYNDYFFIGFDNDKCLLLVNSNIDNIDSISNLKSRGLKLMTQQAGESGNRSRLYSLLGSSPISAVISSELLLKSMNSNYMSRLLQNSKSYDLSDVYYLANMDFMEKGISLDVSIDSESDDFNNFMDKSLQCFGDIDGNKLDRFSYDDALFAVMNIDGYKFFNQLKTSLPKDVQFNFVDIINQLKRDSIDVEKMCGAIDGDVYLSLQNFIFTSESIPIMTFMAKLSNDRSIHLFSSALDILAKEQNDISFDKISDSYLLKQLPIDLDTIRNSNKGSNVSNKAIPLAYLGEYDGYLYLSSVKYKKQPLKEKTMKMLKNKISDKNIFISLNLNRISPVISVGIVTKQIDIFDRLNIYCKGYKATAELFLNKSWRELYKENNK